MKKKLMIFGALLVSLALALPAFAVELQYGGQFRTRAVSEYGLADDNGDRNQNFIDQRLRFQFRFVASEHLRLVTNFEIGDLRWGNQGNLGRGSGSGVGSDGVNIETRELYADFGIPNTPVWARVGIQHIPMANAWISDDTHPAIVFRANFDPISVRMGYMAEWNPNTSRENDNIDGWFGEVQYSAQGVAGPGKLDAGMLVHWQNARNTLASLRPSSGNATHVAVFQAAGIAMPFVNLNPPFGANTTGYLQDYSGIVSSNDLVNLAFNLGYSMDWWNVKLGFIKNLGQVKLVGQENIEYQGWLLDGAVNFMHGPYTMNVRGFYASGNDRDSRHQKGFTGPVGQSKQFSEIIGGGILDTENGLAHRSAAGAKTNQWVGYYNPTNLWTISVGGSWQALEATKISAAYWYFGTPEKVDNRQGTTSSDIGHELNLYVTQGIVDGLTLDLVGAYLITGDAYSAQPNGDDNVYQVGARLSWNF